MGVNGVSHHVVEDDLEGCAAVLQWLSYIAPVLGGPSAALPTTDPIERNIGYLPGPGAAAPPGRRPHTQRPPRRPACPACAMLHSGCSRGLARGQAAAESMPSDACLPGWGLGNAARLAARGRTRCCVMHAIAAAGNLCSAMNGGGLRAHLPTGLRMCRARRRAQARSWTHARRWPGARSTSQRPAASSGRAACSTGGPGRRRRLGGPAGVGPPASGAGACAGRRLRRDLRGAQPAAGVRPLGRAVHTLGVRARSVVTGRARLGGIAVGVIAVETQTVMLNIPADPGAPDSSERILPQVRQGCPLGPWCASR